MDINHAWDKTAAKRKKRTDDSDSESRRALNHLITYRYHYKFKSPFQRSLFRRSKRVSQTGASRVARLARERPKHLRRRRRHDPRPRQLQHRVVNLPTHLHPGERAQVIQRLRHCASARKSQVSQSGFSSFSTVNFQSESNRNKSNPFSRAVRTFTRCQRARIVRGRRIVHFTVVLPRRHPFFFVERDATRRERF